VSSYLKTLATNPQAVIVYDNINFKDMKRDEVIGNKSEMRSMTTAAVVICPELPPGGLDQSMHDPSKPLYLHDILSGPGISGGDDIGLKITRCLIADAIKTTHPASVKAVFHNSETYPKMPELDKIDANRTAFWQFGAVFEDEGTIDGTYRVHEQIFLRQLGLRAPKDPGDSTPDDFRSRLWLVHGDQLTADRIRSVKSEQTRAKRAFDRRDWLLGVPAWFHIQMNLLLMIVRTHWGPTDYRLHAHHSLRSDITAWNRSYSSRDNVKYHQMKPLVEQGFTARVTALFYTAMRRRGHLPSINDVDPMGCTSAAIKDLTPEQFHALIEDVRTAAFTLDAWQGTQHADIEFRTMCRMLQEIELFLTIAHAVKTGDIGLLRRLVDPLIVVFFGAGQHNYGKEMLFYRWLLSPVNTDELQRAILASGLVNWVGRDTTHKPIDLSLEHLNGSCKIEMKCYKNSTHDVDTIFNRVCLSNSWIRTLREKIEDTFGTENPGKHTNADATLDIFVLARNLFVDGLAEPRNQQQLASLSDVFDSQDIFQVGMDKLAEKVDAFNKHNIRRPKVSDYPDDEADVESEEATGFADASEYIRSLEDEDFEVEL